MSAWTRVVFGPLRSEWIDVPGPAHLALRLGDSLHIVGPGVRWRLSPLGDPARMTLRRIRRRLP